jgi:hypothetical protein
MTCCLCDSGTTSESPAPKCKNRRCRICLKVANVDTEIKRAVATLQSLLTKRCDLLSERNHTHDIMHRLPLELKNRIFELALPTRDEWGGDVLRGKSPSCLTSICRNWRDIAQSNPFLWSTIPIILGTPSTTDPNWVVFVYDWIQRSRNSPLTLHISIYDDGSEDYMEKDELEKQLNDVLDVMAQCLNEWQSLFLEVPFSFLKIFHDGDNDFKSHLLTVRRLQIQVISTEEWEDDIDEPVQPVPSTMSPETIKIVGFPFKSLPISCNHLTFAKLMAWDLGRHRAALPTCVADDLSCSISHARLWYLRLCNAPDYSSKACKHCACVMDRPSTEACAGHAPWFPYTSMSSCHTKWFSILWSLRHPSFTSCDRSSCPLTRITLLRMITELPSELLRPLTWGDRPSSRNGSTTMFLC